MIMTRVINQPQALIFVNFVLQSLDLNVSFIPEADIIECHGSYCKRLDLIKMFPLNRKTMSANQYCSVFLHEVVHASGHRLRLKRDTLLRPYESRRCGALEARWYTEEVLAELGALWLCKYFGIDTPEIYKASGEYIERNSPFGVFRHARHFHLIEAVDLAVQALEYLTGEIDVKASVESLLQELFDKGLLRPKSVIKDYHARKKFLKMIEEHKIKVKSFIAYNPSLHTHP